MEDNAPQQRFSRGDVVLHARRPEWGPGKVEQASNQTIQGRASQRLVVRFANHGRVTLNTAAAPNVAGDHRESNMNRSQFSSGATASSQDSGGWLANLERQNGSGADTELTRLPDALRDPFASLGQRLRATMDTYRFTSEPRALLDWAVAQTGLSDPMTRYTRHELEQALPWFQRNRDEHLKDLVIQLKRAGKSDAINTAIRETRLPEARQALQRFARA